MLSKKTSSLLVDLYELTMAQAYHKHKPATAATFELFIRSSRRPCYVACGIDEVLESVANLSFDKGELDYLRSLTLFDDNFLEYLKNFRFRGDVWSVREPEIVFAGEPIIRVTANIIEAQIIESVLLNQINLATTLATKALAVVCAAKGRGVYDFSLRRTQGEDASLAAAKYSYLMGARGTSNTLAGYRWRIPVVGTMAHSFVMSFEREVESFLAFSDCYPAKSILLVDTYDTKMGIENAVRVARYLKRRGLNLLGIRLDSGDIASFAKYARHVLDTEGLIDVMIVASGNLDEHKITELLKHKAPVDAFGVGTNMGCSSDLPYTDVIYKLVELKDRKREFTPTMKLSEGKITYPSKKQIIRSFENGMMKEDCVALSNESVAGKKLLKKLVEKGKLIYKPKTIEEKRKIFAQKFNEVPAYLKELKTQRCYPVTISAELNSLVESLKRTVKCKLKEKIVFFDIDTQFDFIRKAGALPAPGAESIVSNLKKLTDCARQENITILSSQDTHRLDDVEFKDFPPHSIEGKRGWRKLPETLLKKHKVISCKKSYSDEELRKMLSEHDQLILQKSILNVFANPSTSGLLNLLFPDAVVVYGVVTEHCIREAVEGLIKGGFRVIIVTDAIKEISKSDSDRLLSNWKRKGVEFSKTKDIVKTYSSARR